MWHSTVPGTSLQPRLATCQGVGVQLPIRGTLYMAYIEIRRPGVEAKGSDQDDCICAGCSWWPCISRGLATDWWPCTLQGFLFGKC